jgi:pimeloyl-ACP methyl ester carboxylesterase
MMSATQSINLKLADRPLAIEAQWVGVTDGAAEVMVFLHEGLGSVSMWRDFPHTLCMALGFRGLVYSRPGYGHSTPRSPDDHWGIDFMHRQADEVLPALLSAAGIDASKQPPWLFGHSDGGSIALLYAMHRPDQLSGCIVLAPHIFVEDIALKQIAEAARDYQHGDLRLRLARHHAQPDSAFWGWNNAWLNPQFKSWRIDADLQRITCPLLAIQGVDDEYGTLAQIRDIANRVSQCKLRILENCGHSPHRDQPRTLIQAIQHFLQPEICVN